MRSLKIYNGPFFAGVLTEVPGEGYVFRYDDEYFANPSLPAISLTISKANKEYRNRFLFPFFSNMLSEGHNRQVQAKMLHIAYDDDFGILAATAGTDTPGTITVKQNEDN
ncbi:MAG: HipA N-terminal domain-containing protein [Bacteroidales bacterium]|nr:HipA N-terminal domain-containing protein [Bacteroidales bacterium]